MISEMLFLDNEYTNMTCESGILKPWMQTFEVQIAKKMI